MPVEINELIVRTIIEPQASESATLPNDNTESRMAEKEALMKACVERVLKVIKNKEER